MRLALLEWVNCAAPLPFQARAGGAWLGAGPEGERKIEGTRASPAFTDDSRGCEAFTSRGCCALTSTRCALCSTQTAAAAAYDANGSAPAGESPTSTAAHAAARPPRLHASLTRRPREAKAHL